MFSSIHTLLEHIQEVEQEIVELSQSSTLIFSKFIEKHSLELDEDISQALQRQDMISQQLSATINAIEEAKKSIEKSHNSMKYDATSLNSLLEDLDVGLQKILLNAKEKKEAFSGNFHSQNDNEIEFF